MNTDKTKGKRTLCCPTRNPSRLCPENSIFFISYSFILPKCRRCRLLPRTSKHERRLLAENVAIATATGVNAARLSASFNVKPHSRKHKRDRDRTGSRFWSLRRYQQGAKKKTRKLCVGYFSPNYHLKKKKKKKKKSFCDSDLSFVPLIALQYSFLTGVWGGKKKK